MAITARLNHPIENQWIELNIHAHSDYQLPSQIWLQLSHHTRSGFDQKVLLKRIGDIAFLRLTRYSVIAL